MPSSRTHLDAVIEDFFLVTPPLESARGKAMKAQMKCLYSHELRAYLADYARKARLSGDAYKAEGKVCPSIYLTAAAVTGLLERIPA